MGLDPQRYDDLLLAESAGKLTDQQQSDLNLVRQAGAAPEIQWSPDHPHIQAAEQQYGLPKGILSAFVPVESAGKNDAKSPTNTTGLFQVTLGTGAPYGLTPENRTNPYVETDVAARLVKDLLDKNNGSIKGVLHDYKGPEITDGEYFNRYAKAFQQYGGDPTLLKDRTSVNTPTAIAVHRPSEVPEPSVGTSTTTTPATQTVGQEIRERAGFGTPGAPQPTVGNGLFSAIGRGAEKLNAALGGVPGQTAENLGTGPIGPLLKLLELPAATVGTGIDRATGSSTAGTVGQVLTDLIGPKLLTGAGSRLIAPVLPREMARSFVPRAAARLDLRDASRLTPGLENTVSTATTRAEQLAQQAEAATAQAGTHATTAADLKSQAAAAAATPPTLPSALTTAHQQALQNAGHDLLAVGARAQTDVAAALPVWRKAAGGLLDQAENIPGAATTLARTRQVLTNAGRVVVGDNGVAVDLSRLGLTPELQDVVQRSFDGTITLGEARQLESALGRAGYKSGKAIGTPEEGARRLLYSTVNSDIHTFMMTPAENAGGSGAVAALQNAKDNYRRGVLLFNDAAKRLVTGARNAPKASESVIDTVFRPDHFTDLMDFKQLVEPETYQAATETWYNQLVRRASAGPDGLTAASYEKQIRPYLVNNHLEQILPPAQAQQIRSILSQALDAAGQPKRAAAVLQGQAMQAKQAAQAATAQAKSLNARVNTANQQAVGATRQIKQLARQSEQATKVLAAPTKTRRLLRAGGAVIKPIAYGAGVGAGGAAAYRAFNSK